ncbi:PACE efflux transporter [Psychrobacter sp. A3]|uniref:PACE efflux transporter n=1 Tax=Psychrobacter sp. A3 TaxID=2992754 RepID=UPI00237C4852|nr:PACE efflux transporter [Psychrobacter sp. A3]MDE0491806.1 PACE efflux transporter [Psychrobacter sp. A3]
MTVFEIIAIISSTYILMMLSGSDAAESLPVAVMVSLAAVIWNFLYNTVFEAWERRRQVAARTLLIRSVHAVGFEGGLVLICLPLYMLWYDVGLVAAFMMEAACYCCISWYILLYLPWYLTRYSRYHITISQLLPLHKSLCYLISSKKGCLMAAFLMVVLFECYQSLPSGLATDINWFALFNKCGNALNEIISFSQSYLLVYFHIERFI